MQKYFLWHYYSYTNRVMKLSVVPKAGLEPALREETDFESVASTNSAIRA